MYVILYMNINKITKKKYSKCSYYYINSIFDFKIYKKRVFQYWWFSRNCKYNKQ